ncbi:hypothetical protein GPROT1_01275 [Gammaproteobacteria bacterium]|nr:hypothetical protein GPROT1_01275 [Gammaproteobacteria bacterium]
MSCRPKRRRPRRGRNWKHRHITPIESGISGLSCVSESLPTVSLLDDRSAIRQALRALLKDLNAKRLHKET